MDEQILLNIAVAFILTQYVQYNYLSYENEPWLTTETLTMTLELWLYDRKSICQKPWFLHFYYSVTQ